MPRGMDSLEIGHFVCFIGDSVPQGFVNKFYQVTGKEPIYYESGLTSAFNEWTATVASGGNSGYKNLEVLEPDEGHLYGFDVGFKDGCRYYLKIPTGHDRLGLDEDMNIGFLNNLLSDWVDPDPQYGFWVLPGQYPAFNAYNDSFQSLTPKVWMKGCKFEIMQVVEETLIARLRGFKEGRGGQPSLTITVGGVSG